MNDTTKIAVGALAVVGAVHTYKNAKVKLVVAKTKLKNKI